MKYGTTTQITRRPSGHGRMLGWLVGGLVVLGFLGSGTLSLAGSTGWFSGLGLTRDDTYSYYTHREYGASRWKVGNDPYDAHALGSKRRFGNRDARIRSRYGFDYDDPYGNAYGGYGHGYEQPYRTLRKSVPRNVSRPYVRQPLAADPTLDELMAYGMAVDTTYQRYSGYSNPYLNMLRLDFGPQYGSMTSVPEVYPIARP